MGSWKQHRAAESRLTADARVSPHRRLDSLSLLVRRMDPVRVGVHPYFISSPPTATFWSPQDYQDVNRF
jgi:hypothetical protein